MADPPSQTQFDVFLSHNSKDKPAVIALARRLQQSGVKVWLDAWELRPGHPWQEALENIIKNTHSAAVLVGKDGLGPWEDVEMRALLNQFVKRKLPVIPVLLPDCPKQPDLPLLLQEFTWVDCRDGGEEEGFSRLVWGITGVKPEATPSVVVDKPLENQPNERADSRPDLKVKLEIPDQTEPPQIIKTNGTPKEVRPRVPRWYYAFPVALVVLVVSILQLQPPEEKKPEGVSTTGQNSNQKPAVVETNPISNVVSVPVLSPSAPIEPAMVSLSGGEFEMGSNKDDPLAFDDELPKHKVSVQPFSIGKYEVTVGEYAIFAKATDHQSKGCYVNLGFSWDLDTTKSWSNPGFKQTERHPVVCVSHQDAEAYARWLKETTGKPYRLPSEAEWEYAARAGTTTPWYWPGGEQAADDYAWYSNNAGNTTHPVGEKKPNAFGLYDMAGNAWEWVEDSWHENYQDAPSDGKAWLDDTNAYRVSRGGSWDYYGRNVRSAYRFGSEPGRRNYIGFRLALGPKGQ